jgi:hypothetical protein
VTPERILERTLVFEVARHVVHALRHDPALLQRLALERLDLSSVHLERSAPQLLQQCLETVRPRVVAGPEHDQLREPLISDALLHGCVEVARACKEVRMAAWEGALQLRTQQLPRGVEEKGPSHPRGDQPTGEVVVTMTLSVAQRTLRTRIQGCVVYEAQ